MKKLYLASEGNSRLLGVCGGIGETYDIDPTVIRIIVVTFGLLIFPILIPLVLSYFAAWLLMPQRPAENSGDSSGD